MCWILKKDSFKPNAQNTFHDTWFQIWFYEKASLAQQGHSGEYGNAAKLVGEMSKSVMQLISIHF